MEGLRERKKQQTRLAISQVATALFIERGFDQVTVAQVADAAQVSVNTVFNYFSSKEELFFDRAAEVEEAAARIVRERQAGESVLEALRRGIRQVLRGQAGRPAGDVRPFLATVEASPALTARLRVLFERTETHLALAIIETTGARADDLTARTFAAMATGLLVLLAREFQARVLRGEPPAIYRPALERMAVRGFDLLDSGAGNYGAKAGR